VDHGLCKRPDRRKSSTGSKDEGEGQPIGGCSKTNKDGSQEWDVVYHDDKTGETTTIYYIKTKDKNGKPTVWPRLAQHGYWFKAEPYPEEFFAKYHRGFIETVITGKSSTAMPGRPESPWNYIPAPIRSWASADDLDHYARAFADPASHAHAIWYYRDALPFHIVHEDPAAAHGEFRIFESAQDCRDLAPSRRLRQASSVRERHGLRAGRSPQAIHRAGAMVVCARAASGASGAPGAVETVPSGYPFLDQFSRYFPDLRARPIDAGHFSSRKLPKLRIVFCWTS
jgi:hypothetical protein